LDKGAIGHHYVTLVLVLLCRSDSRYISRTFHAQ
jgi:hypothetical protein